MFSFFDSFWAIRCEAESGTDWDLDDQADGSDGAESEVSLVARSFSNWAAKAVGLIDARSRVLSALFWIVLHGDFLSELYGGGARVMKFDNLTRRPLQLTML